MRKFILTILFFGSMLIVVLATTLFSTHKIIKRQEFCASEMYYSEEFDYAFKKNNIDIIALGNSKLLSAIDKKVLEDELNMKSVILGYSSANISISKLILESYLNQCIEKPKIILLEVSWFTFNDRRTDFHPIGTDLLLRDLNLWRNFIKYYPKTMNNLSKVLGYYLIDFFEFTEDEFKKNYDINFKEPSPLSKDYVFDQYNFLNIFPDSIAGIDEVLLEDYESIIHLCQSHEIKVVLFTAPEDEMYSSSQLDRMEIKSIFKETENQDIVYFDYTLDGDLWNKNYEFWLANSHHVNDKNMFTKVLTNDIRLKAP